MFADTRKVIMYTYLEHEPSTKAHTADFLCPILEAWAEREGGTEQTREKDMGRRRQEHFSSECERGSGCTKHDCE